MPPEIPRSLEPGMRPASASELRAMVREAHDRHTRLRVAGRGTWPARSAAIATDATPLELSALTGVTEYVPGDLTLTARAGTTIAECDAATLAHGQWCPLLPWGSDDGTLGATFATASRGPCSTRLGAPRDLAIGLEFVDGTGALVRAGARVVKNVAGFDLTRLLIGSWGSLGVITEVSVRLTARPTVDETWIVTVEPGDTAAAARFETLRAGPLAPIAVEPLDDDPIVGRMLVRLGGNASLVGACRTALMAIGRTEQSDSRAWTRLRARDPRPLGPLASSAIADPLSQRVKRQFDPRHILNPGIMGEEVA